MSAQVKLARKIHDLEKRLIHFCKENYLSLNNRIVLEAQREILKDT